MSLNEKNTHIEESDLMGKLLYQDFKPRYTLIDMLINRRKREEIFNYYDSIYNETEEEKEIFRMMTKRRKNQHEHLGGNPSTK